MPQRRVLVVDDEPRMLDIVKYFLEQGGYEVEPVTTGEKALAAVRRAPFDVAVLDIVLGTAATGRQQLKKLKNAETCVLFMSSKVGWPPLPRDYEGRAEFLLKPFKKEALLALQKLLDGGGRQAPAPTRARGEIGTHARQRNGPHQVETRARGGSTSSASTARSTGPTSPRSRPPSRPSSTRTPTGSW